MVDHFADKNNTELLHAKTEIISGKNPNDTKALEEVIKYHERKANMILGEGLVFGFMLIIGLYLIQRLFNKEMEGIKSQKNFLLSITHELKSPIASVNLITETLQKRELTNPLKIHCFPIFYLKADVLKN